MNIENINTAIEILERVGTRGGKFDLCRFQGVPYTRTEDDAVSCGTPACFSGWINLSPEWQAQPNADPHTMDTARYRGMNAESSMAQWLGIPVKTAHSMIFSTLLYDGKSPKDVTLCDVIKRLKEIRDGKQDAT